MTELMQASHQWSSRPADERFTSLYAMQDHFETVRNRSRAVVTSNRQLQVIPQDDHRGLVLQGGAGVGYAPTNHAFNQLSTLAGAPAGYLRTLPAEMAADCLNWGLHKRDVEDVGLLLYKNGDSMLRAATGPNYGRIWNADIIASLVSKFGDGVNGDWRVPGEFGKRVVVDQNNTTLYASDRDMFVFLADEDRRIDMPNRRDGKSGSLARGFFIWNSEVGDKTVGIATFLFDYVCCNRIVWGASNVQNFKIRHTKSAPDKFVEEMTPALLSYAKSSSAGVLDGVKAAQSSRIDDPTEFLSKRFSTRLAASFQNVHQLEENRPIETVWDAVTAVTAHARSIEHQDTRVELERKAGELMKLAA